MANSEQIMLALRQLLEKEKLSTQKEIQAALQRLGYSVNQTRVSRLLRQLHAIKVDEATGLHYRLPFDLAPHTIHQSLADLILSIAANETLIVVRTKPGSASLIASVFDRQLAADILGTLAGDDTVLVVPRITKEIAKVVNRIKALLSL